MTQPNIIVFFTDQQRWDTTGVPTRDTLEAVGLDWVADDLSL